MYYGRWLYTLAGAATLALTVQMGSANAATLSLGASIDGGPMILLPDIALAPDVLAFSGALGAYNGNIVIGFTTPFSPIPTLLRTGTMTLNNAVGGDHTLDLFITAQDLNFPTAVFSSAFTASSPDTPGTLTLTVETYIDLANGQFALTTLLGSANFVEGTVATDADFTAAATDASYSLTAVYRLSSSGLIASAATITVAAVPGPIAGAGIPALLMTLGAIGWVRRRNAAMA